MAKTATASATDIIETWRAEGIRYVRFELPDMHGTSRTKIVPIGQAAGYCDEGLNMYGGAAVLDSPARIGIDVAHHEPRGIDRQACGGAGLQACIRELGMLGFSP